MHIYLPIAEVSVNLLLLLAIGGGVGFLSGLFGVGGGFLLTPLLIFVGIPPAIAVGSEANQLVAASLSGVIAHWRGGRVDLRMGIMLLVGGLIGSTLGVSIFAWLRDSGQIDIVIKLLYVVLLGAIGAMMMVESVRANLKNLRNKESAEADEKTGAATWRQRLPWQMHFPTSNVTISPLLPIGLGVIVGILAAVMGIGGGFIMVPAMIYLLGMPTAIVVGTSLFQILFVASNVTLQQAMRVQTVDVVLALLLMIGSVLGAQIGVRAGARLKGEELRFLLAFIVLAVCGWMVFNLTSKPDFLFTLVTAGGH
ncbi:MAG: sulfite exporter TauE/SafE family protein [Gammaproteobacteria bacterium]|nr:MAG: sulfite exporter TauE/SafE family protein [Gammaproteobacteria bacterium]RLA15607.1 MAG: sulfite exporter TauE/SafE family protein [Gammaproteobacteria bacterium]RLA18099.1 MAG: sulfite exporter TauE/SafE family protein [Gammaproteobacteria bacterium]